jgi:hypothetical protein
MIGLKIISSRKENFALRYNTFVQFKMFSSYGRAASGTVKLPVTGREGP